MTDIAITRQEVIFVVPETSWGQLAYPEASHLVIPAGNGSIGQDLSYTESDEIRDTRSLIARFRDKIPPGNWSFSTYIRPGTTPMGDALFEALLGSKSGTTYSPSKTVPSVSIWVRKGHTVFFADGAVVNEARFSATSKGAATIEWSGNFRRLGWAGEDALAASATAGATSITVGDGKKYTPGAKIVIGSDDNGGNGYTVTAVSGNTLTIDPGLSADAASGAPVTPWLPAVSASYGDPIEARTFSVSFDGVTKPVRSIEFTISNEMKLIDDELTTSLYPTGKLEGNRRVSGRISVYFRKDDLSLFKDAYDAATTQLQIQGGEGAGSIFRVLFPKASLEVPSIGTEAPAFVLDVNFVALAESGEDEVQIQFA